MAATVTATSTATIRQITHVSIACLLHSPEEKVEAIRRLSATLSERGRTQTPKLVESVQGAEHSKEEQITTPRAMMVAQRVV